MRNLHAALLLPAGLCLCSCVSLSLAGEQVRMTRHESDVKDCRYVGDVQAKPPFHGPNDAESKLRNEAAKLGGDVVLARGYVGTIEGKVYDCGGRYSRPS